MTAAEPAEILTDEYPDENPERDRIVALADKLFRSPVARKILSKIVAGTRAQNDVEDIIQGALIKVFQKWDTFRSESKLNSWLLKVLINQAHNAVKYYRCRCRDEDKTLAYDDAFGDGLGASKNRRPQVDPIAHLVSHFRGNPRLREILGQYIAPDTMDMILLRMEGNEYKEVAAMLGIPIGTVKSKTHRAMAEIIDNEALQSLLEENWRDASAN
ncbi:MAG: sigma-70 family RNA polymerase sigma factor [Candidatus Gracilibacteria bacterium]